MNQENKIKEIKEPSMEIDLPDQCPFIDLKFGSSIFIFTTVHNLFDYFQGIFENLSSFIPNDVYNDENNDNDDNNDNDINNDYNDDNNDNDINNDDNEDYFYPMAFTIISIK